VKVRFRVRLPRRYLSQRLTDSTTYAGLASPSISATTVTTTLTLDESRHEPLRVRRDGAPCQEALRSGRRARRPAPLGQTQVYTPLTASSAGRALQLGTFWVSACRNASLGRSNRAG